MMSNNEILELGQQCKSVSVPRRIREFLDQDVVGYEVVRSDWKHKIILS